MISASQRSDESEEEVKEVRRSEDAALFSALGGGRSERDWGG